MCRDGAYLAKFEQTFILTLINLYEPTPVNSEVIPNDNDSEDLLAIKNLDLKNTVVEVEALNS